VRAALLLLAVWAPWAAAQTVVPDAARQAELVRLVRQDCGSCHGMRLTGGLGPALTPQALADRPVDAMAATIYHGRPGTPMPGWAPLLSEADAAWIAAQLARGLPEERQVRR
jgi:cytochrome c55X